jgi:hypothetical protein
LGSSLEGTLPEAGGTRLEWLSFLNKRESDIGMAQKLQKGLHARDRDLVSGGNNGRCGEAEGKVVSVGKEGPQAAVKTNLWFKLGASER